MKVAIDRDHRHHFDSQGMIEFEGLIKESLVAAASSALSETIAKRLKLPVDRLGQQLPSSLMEAGRDLWRDAAAIKQLATQQTLAYVASELFLKTPLRLGYDQLFIPDKKPEAALSYYALSNEPLSLKEISSIQGVVGGVMVCLEKPETASSTDFTLFAPAAGSAIFFSAEISLPWELFLRSCQGGRYLLVAFTAENSVYIQNEQDPNQHSLKNYGFTFGDRLNDRSHPILYR